MGNLTKDGQQLRMTQEGAAHDQLVVYEEGRGDSHPEADALVHVQLTCGLVDYRVNSVTYIERLLGSCSGDAHGISAWLEETWAVTDLGKLLRW